MLHHYFEINVIYVIFLHCYFTNNEIINVFLIYFCFFFLQVNEKLMKMGLWVFGVNDSYL